MRDFSTLRILPRSGSTAWVLRSRPCLAEPPAESPSTTNSSASEGSLTEQSASLPGSVEFSSADLRRVRSRALRAASRARWACTDFMITARASLGFSSRNSPRPVLTIDSTKPAMPGLPSLVFVWPSNWGSRSLTEITAVRPSRTSSPERLSSFSFSRPLLARVLVQRARERRAEAGHVRAALARVDVVGERVDRLLVGGVPLHRDLGGAFLALAGEEDDLAVDGVLVLVQVGDEVLDAALVLELGGVALAALVDDRDLQAAREERGLAQALLERVEVEVERLEDVGVGQERDGGAGGAVLGRASRPSASSSCGAPREYSCDQTWPSRRISTCSRSESALTTETPTPCRPPETL